MGIGYGFVWPFMETFRAISREGVPIYMRLIRCFTDGTWSNVWGACTIVRDFADFSFHSYFSIMDQMVEWKGEEPVDIKVYEVAGCVLVAIVGIVVDFPIIPLLVLYKAPIMLVKGWHRLIQDLVGREGPFLETVCVPFAGLWILLWPFVVLLASFAGITSIIGFGCYAAVVAFQENSLKRGLLYVIASISLFDEYTNDLLYLREGSCFPRPKYREKMDSSSLLVPGKGLHEHLQAIHTREPLIMTTAEQKSAVKAVVIWDSFFKACVDIGKELIRDEAIGLADLEAWRHAKNKIVNVGIPSHVFLQCFLRSIKRGSVGFLMRDDVEITHVNRPEGRIFDWLYEPMSIMKEQIRRLNLQENEQLYLYKFCLYSGDTKRIESWENGGVPSPDEIRRAQLEGISRRLQGFCLTLSRLPTSRRRFFEVLGVLEQEAKNAGHIGNGYDIEAAT
ncbi:uncharacterized membrane protein At3g27390-like isoform X3 [Momordica charantia]|nr:uncharacterized membrane protein At3g27390-like isoform X3 [Momordica charantia]